MNCAILNIHSELRQTCANQQQFGAVIPHFHAFDQPVRKHIAVHVPVARATSEGYGGSSSQVSR